MHIFLSIALVRPFWSTAKNSDLSPQQKASLTHLEIFLLPSQLCFVENEVHSNLDIIIYFIFFFEKL